MAAHSCAAGGPRQAKPGRVPPRFAIPRGEAHVWLGEPAVGDPSSAELSSAELSQPERDRMNRFHFAHDRLLYLAAHSLLRRALSPCALDVAPSEWVIGTTPHGRPAMAAPWDDLHFNLSHTHGLVACVVVRDADCGIDVEALAGGDIALISRHVLAQAELVAVRAAPPPARRDLFCRFWTLKEAYVKARGHGFALPLDRCVFTVDGRAVTMVEHPDQVDQDGWQFMQYLPTPRHVLALALHAAAPVTVTVHTGWPVTAAGRRPPAPRPGCASAPGAAHRDR